MTAIYQRGFFYDKMLITWNITYVTLLSKVMCPNRACDYQLFIVIEWFINAKLN